MPTAGTVRFLTKDEALTLLPQAYPRLRGERVGMMGRPPAWWVLSYENRMTTGYFRVAAHYGHDGQIDGMIGYRPVEIRSPRERHHRVMEAEHVRRSDDDREQRPGHAAEQWPSWAAAHGQPRTGDA